MNCANQRLLPAPTVERSIGQNRNGAAEPRRSAGKDMMKNGVILSMMGAVLLVSGCASSKRQPNEPSVANMGCQIPAVASLNTRFGAIQGETCPSNGMTEAEVAGRWGTPRGATTRDVEKKNGNYDKDGLGLYRWFYDTQLSWKEEGTGLQVGTRVEMIVYFVEGKTVGSQLKLNLSSPGLIFVTSSGAVQTFSGQPPVLRRTPSGNTAWDFHQNEGQVDLHSRLTSTLNAYRDYWHAKWTKKAESARRD